MHTHRHVVKRKWENWLFDFFLLGKLEIPKIPNEGFFLGGEEV